MAILLKNTTYIDWQTFEFTEADLLVEEGATGEIQLFYPGEAEEKENHTIDCTGKFVTKSMANGHHHVYSALARGMPAPPKQPNNFHEILQYIWWRLDKALDLEMIEASALYTAMECAKNGVTFAIDHHASPYAIEGSLETIAKAFDKVGVSHLLCYEISDRDGESIASNGLNETKTYLSKNQGLVGLHASFTVGDKTMKAAAQLANKYNSGVHIHVAEDKFDQEECKRNYGIGVIERLQNFGILDIPKSILAHCIHISDEERKILKNAKCRIVQNAESNLNNSVGFFSSKGLGENIILGTDGMHSNMIRSAQASYFYGIGIENICPDGIYKRLRNVHQYLNENDFSGDGENNLMVLDYPSPTEMNATNFLGHFFYGLESKHIQHVISNGKLIVKDKLIQTVNETEILGFAKEQANRLWSKLK
ncbi:amidohydrolase family protein [Desulfosarcina sp.]|nr:amidohydrolase family protein [Desulfosarcina sp.]